MTKIKICGLSRPEDIQTANELNLDYIGFVFAKSRRQVTPAQAAQLKALLDPTIQAVGVFVNAPQDNIISLVSDGVIDVIQLHGQETERDIAQLKSACPQAKIIKAISVQSTSDILAWSNSTADFLLLDNGAGGTGQLFDWGILPQLEGFQKPYFIAGGLRADNVTDVLGYRPYGVDVSGGVETDGLKDSDKMIKFADKVRNHHE